MKKVNKTFVVYCLLFILSTLSISVKATEEGQKDTKETSTEIIKLNDRNKAYDYIVLYCSLGLNVVALILISVCLKRQHSNKKNICNIHEKLKQITAELSASPISNGNNADSAVNLKQKEIEQVVDRVLNERKIDAIVDRVLECVHLDNKNKNTPIVEQSPMSQNEVQETIILLYASAANRATNTFYNVTEQPIPGSSIYVLKLSGNEAAFEVYSGAHEKILKDANFLECACELQLHGKSKVITIRSGSSEKQPDGQWSIKSKAIIKFE